MKRKYDHVTPENLQCMNCYFGEPVSGSRLIRCDNPVSDFYGRTCAGVRKDKFCPHGRNKTIA